MCVDIVVDTSPPRSASLLLKRERVSLAELMRSVYSARLVRRLVDPMMPRVKIWHVALVLVFVLCQVIGVMCALADLWVSSSTPLVEERMACPMHGTTMCPPLVTSSPERQIKNTMAGDVNHALALLNLSTAFTSTSVQVPRSRSSVCSIVPICIESSSVLRI